VATTSDISKGMFIRHNGELVQILEWEHRTPGNLRAFYQAKMRNLKNGKSVENRFRSGETVEIVRVETKDYQYLYRDGNFLVCMDQQTFDQINIEEHLVGDAIQFLKEEMIITIVLEEGITPISAELQSFVVLEITYTEPGKKGDTATKTLKPATLETGATIQVPLFVDIGEKIKVDTRTGSYVERVK